MKSYIEKLKPWRPLPVTFFASTLFSAIGLTIDQSCSPINSVFCSAWAKFQWETVLAGTLGLCGGIFVIMSTRQQVAAMRETANDSLAQSNLHEARKKIFPQRKTLELIEDLQTVLLKEEYFYQKKIGNTENTEDKNTKKLMEKLDDFSSFLKDTQKHLEETIKYYGPGHFDFRCYGTITILLNKFNILPDIHKTLTENNYDEFCKDILVFF